VLSYSREPCHTVCPQSGLLPGVFANTDAAAAATWVHELWPTRSQDWYPALSHTQRSYRFLA